MSKVKTRQIKQPKVESNSLKPITKMIDSDVAKNAAGLLAERYLNMTNTLGKYFGGGRDIYQAMGYPLTISFKDYYNQYSRNGVGKRVIKSFPNACWRFTPIIRDVDKGKNSKFNRSFKKMSKKLKLFKFLKKVDCLSRIGEYGVLFLGFNDGQTLETPVKKGSSLVYLQAYRQDQASINKYETNPTNERNGLPVEYSINSSVTGMQNIGRVHHTRILHIAEETEGNNVIGTPALKGVYNNIQNIEMISASATEGYWRGGFAGLVAEIDKDADFSDEDKVAFKEEMQRYIDGYQRTLRAQGGKFKFPQASVLQPGAFLDAQYDIISADTQLPKRILTGSELAEVASTQDAGNWNNVVDDRRVNYCGPDIVDEFVNRCIEVGALPNPKNDEYVVEWPDMESADDNKRSETALNNSRALVLYAKSPEAKEIMTKEQFLSNVMGISVSDT